MTASRTRRSLVLSLALVATVVSTGVVTAPSTSAAEGGSGAVTVTKTVTRSHLLADGSSDTVDSRTVTMTVSQTKALHSRQPITVSWSGARPTAGLYADPNAAEARQQDYPFVLIECRGVDSTTVPVPQRLRPETCWTGSERERKLLDNNKAFPPWRLDRYETPADRKAAVGLPDPLPDCYEQYVSAYRSLHFLDVKNRDYRNGGPSCPDVPPESAVVGNASQPPNTTYAATRVNGTGSTKFTVWTSEDNASLGCGGAVKCSLVAIPIMGISCDITSKDLPAADQPSPGTSDTAAAEKRCKASGTYAAGQPPNGGTPDIAVSGSLWFSESNWRNRITVPLGFAPLSNVCDISSSRPGVDIYGSELVASLTTAWRPAFCLSDTRTPFKHVQVGEPQAANLLKNDTIDAAFVSDPPAGGFTSPTVSAPVTLTGFSISYVLDDDQQDPYRKLKLTPRLMAKLLTQSYPGLNPVRSEYDALSHNPLDMSQDPEFLALNPGITRGVADSAAASTLLSLSSDSDVVRALTTYLASDAEAKDWIYGVPDPWGMVVNPSYKRIKLPVTSWPLLDSFEPRDYYAGGQNICLQANPVPILPLIAAPTARLANTALAVQFGSSSSQIVCQAVPDKGAEGAKLVAEGRQSPGYRFVVAVTSLGDAARYELDSAALQTYVKPGSPEKFASAAGRTFVTPTDVSLRAATKLLKTDARATSWTLDYARFGSDASAATAYPGSMLVYLDAPTSGLSAVTANGLAGLLRFAAGPGQVRGLEVGQLPEGYLPLTAANGLSVQRAQTLRAADLIAAQKGDLAPVTPIPGVTTTPEPTVTGGGTGQTSGADASGVIAAGAPTTPTMPEVAPPVVNQGNESAAATGITGSAVAGVASWLIPLIALIAMIGAVATGAISRFGRPRIVP